jgi:hypothetical protein
VLNADELGEKGQARFREICADAQLICNQSDRDRTGWDFLVEFPFEISNGVPAPLESRKAPLSCHVQVKTLREKNDRLQLRLSSAERLAKELKPSFIYVLKVNGALEFTDAYLIHIFTGPLGKILRRLRKEDAAGNSMPNWKIISMSASGDGIQMPPSGKALRDALSSAAGNDLHAYAAEKKKQLATLGFDERPYTTEMTLHLDNHDDLVDMFLGLKTDVRASNLYAEHTRFGIKLPLAELSDQRATITVQPTPVDTCTITVRSHSLSTPAVFKGKVFLPAIPGLPADRSKILFRTALFSITCTKAGLKLKTNQDIPAQSPSTWAAYWRLAFVMANGKGVIEIASDGHPINSTINVTEKTTALDPIQCRFLALLCKQASALLKFVGVIQEPEVCMETIIEHSSRIYFAYKLLRRAVGAGSLSLVLDEAPSSFEIIYIDFLKFATVTIGYYCVVQLVAKANDGKIEYKSDKVVLKEMKRLQSAEQYEQLAEIAQKETGCNDFWARPFE